jgi:hypothetical protein
MKGSVADLPFVFGIKRSKEDLLLQPGATDGRFSAAC